MSDLEELRKIEVPRPAPVTRRFAAKIEPFAGFIIYGVLYLFAAVVIGMLGMLVGLGIAKALGAANGSTLVQAMSWIGFLGGCAVAGVAYVGWVRRKRGRAQALIREGTFVEGRVVDRVTDRAAQLAAKLAFGATGQRLAVSWYRVEFEHEGTRRSALVPFATKPTPGDGREILFHPSVRYALGFDEHGKSYVCGVS